MIQQVPDYTSFQMARKHTEHASSISIALANTRTALDGAITENNETLHADWVALVKLTLLNDFNSQNLLLFITHINDLIVIYF